MLQWVFHKTQQRRIIANWHEIGVTAAIARRLRKLQDVAAAMEGSAKDGGERRKLVLNIGTEKSRSTFFFGDSVHVTIMAHASVPEPAVNLGVINRALQDAKSGTRTDS